MKKAKEELANEKISLLEIKRRLMKNLLQAQEKKEAELEQIETMLEEEEENCKHDIIVCFDRGHAMFVGDFSEYYCLGCSKLLHNVTYYSENMNIINCEIEKKLNGNEEALELIFEYYKAIALDNPDLTIKEVINIINKELSEENSQIRKRINN